MATAIYAHGAGAVEAIRGWRLDGLLHGWILGTALVEMGYADDPSSHSARRELLIDALSDDDPDVRYAAGRGLVCLGDPAALKRLPAALAGEQNAVVRAQVGDAIRASGTDETTDRDASGS